MDISLAATYNPRGEIGRLQNLYPMMAETYAHLVIALPPDTGRDDLARISALPAALVFLTTDWAQGRYTALKAACETGADHIHYVDMDRLIRWIETRPAEWRDTVGRVGQSDCLIIGRTPAAWTTHPQVMIQVERIINQTFSYLLGGEFDFGAGSKGFSRRAAEFILANSRPENALGADVEWPVLLHRAGFRLDALLVDGLDWEIPDQYQDRAADAERQRMMAEAYDADVRHWSRRVNDTVNVVHAGLDALQRELIYL